MTRITDSKEDKVRFAMVMAPLYKAHGLQLDREQVAVYHETLKGHVFFEPLEHAVKESLRLDDRFPKIPRLITLAGTYRAPEQRGDLSLKAIEESTLTREEWKDRWGQFMEHLDQLSDEKRSIDDFAGKVEQSPKLRVVK